MIRVLILNKNLDGGTGHYVSQLVKLSQGEITVKLANLNKPKYNQTRIDYCLEENVKRESISKSNFMIVYQFIQQLRWFRKICLNYKPDVVLTVDTHCIFIVSVVLPLMLQAKYKHIATINNNVHKVNEAKLPLWLRLPAKYILSLILKTVDLVITPSRSLSHSIQQYFLLSKLPTSIYYPFSTSIKRLPKSLHKNKYQIITVCRFVEQKDVVTILASFRIVREKFKRVKLLLVGDGPLLSSYQAYIKKEKLVDVSFLGWSNNLIKSYRESDLFVFASHWEGFGIVLVEAMSQGLPVISTDTPYGPKEILAKGKYGVLVPMNNPGVMAKSVIKLLTNPDLYKSYSQKALERAKYFVYNNALEQYRKVIFLLVNEK